MIIFDRLTIFDRFDRFDHFWPFRIFCQLTFLPAHFFGFQLLFDNKLYVSVISFFSVSKFDPIFMAKSVRQMKIRRRPVIISHSVNSGCNLRCVFCDEWKKNSHTGSFISSEKNLPFVSPPVLSLDSSSVSSPDSSSVSFPDSSSVSSPGSSSVSSPVLPSVSSSDPSFEDVCKIIDLAVDFGIGSYNAWSAEPLLRKDLPMIMKYAKSKGMKTFMITNGILLKKRMNELGDVDYISVSVDGPTATREIRKADYKTIIDGIRYASESGLLNTPLLMNCVISAKNLNEVADLARFAKELGNVKMAVEPIYLFKRINETDWDDLIIGPAHRETFVSLMNELIEMKKEGYPLINSKTYLKQIRDGKDIRNCRVDRSILAIDHSNNLYNCRIHNEPLGNVIENSVFDENGKIIKNGITEVWNKTKKERKGMTQNCEGCRFFGYAELTLMNNYNLESFYGYEWL